MTDISKIFLQQAGLKSGNFSASSRYKDVDTSTIEEKNGELVAYLKRRMIPAPEKFYLLQKHHTTEGERPDLLAFKYYSDAERFWQIADANLVLDANDLTDNPGNTIHITLPNGIPGNSNA